MADTDSNNQTTRPTGRFKRSSRGGTRVDGRQRDNSSATTEHTDDSAKKVFDPRALLNNSTDTVPTPDQRTTVSEPNQEEGGRSVGRPTSDSITRTGQRTARGRGSSVWHYRTSLGQDNQSRENDGKPSDR